MSESFEGAMEFARHVTECEFGEHPNVYVREWCETHDYDGTCKNCYESLLARLQRAHERDMEQHMREQYNRGYEDGQRSMDAEHRAVAMRLRALSLDEGSHENLSAIARAVYPTEWGWTQGACRGLRDKLIELMGGVHDDSVPVDASGDAGCDDCHRRDGEAWRVTYDVLGNERHKAVCRLKKLRTSYDGGEDDLWKWLEELYAALGDSPLYLCSMGNIKKQLIHLLGGDEPNFTEIAETIKLGDEFEDKHMENGENHKIATITDELRECVRTADKQYDDTLWYEMGDDSEADHTICYITEGELLRIADRIDEQLKRICEQHEAVLQKTIDEMAEFREHDAEYASTERDMLQKRLDDMTIERDELQAKLERSRAEYCETCEEAETSDILRAKLDAVREALDG